MSPRDRYGDFDDSDGDRADAEAEFDRDSEEDDGIAFANPGGNSALRAATRDNPRNLPCPTCDAPNRLTPADVALGYRCDECADAAERGDGP